MRKILAIALLGLLVATSMPLASATEPAAPAAAILRSHCTGPTIDWAVCYVLTNDAVARAMYEARWALGLVSNTTSDVCDHVTSACPLIVIRIDTDDAFTPDDG